MYSLRNTGKKNVNFRAGISWLDKWIFTILLVYGQVIKFDNSTTLSNDTSTTVGHFLLSPKEREKGRKRTEELVKVSTERNRRMNKEANDSTEIQVKP